MYSDEAGVTLIMAVLILAFIAIGFWFASMSCDAKAVSFQDHSYGPIQGCMVKHNDRWLPLENIRGFDDRD